MTSKDVFKHQIEKLYHLNIKIDYHLIMYKKNLNTQFYIILVLKFKDLFLMNL